MLAQRLNPPLLFPSKKSGAVLPGIPPIVVAPSVPVPFMAKLALLMLVKGIELPALPELRGRNDHRRARSRGGYLTWEVRV